MSRRFVELGLRKYGAPHRGRGAQFRLSAGHEYNRGVTLAMQQRRIG